MQVLHINHDLGKFCENDVLQARTGDQPNPDREKSQRKAFLRELHAMIRLRSPHTVGVYGAITSRPDRLVLVMELLAGGDLRTLLKNAEQQLPDERSRRIIGDICAGMQFLHGKDTVHGDLKSANVLLDGAGRAKVCFCVYVFVPLVLATTIPPIGDACYTFPVYVEDYTVQCIFLYIYNQPGPHRRE